MNMHTRMRGRLTRQSAVWRVFTIVCPRMLRKATASSSSSTATLVKKRRQKQAMDAFHSFSSVSYTIISRIAPV